LGTEFGAYFTLNGGTNWHKIAGPPTIAFRDIKIQRRDNDLVGATFGRGFYVLDDYSVLRDMTDSGFGDGPRIFPIRDAWWYIPSVPSQAAGMPTLGSDSFRSPNPEFGAGITYYLNEKFETGKEQRRTEEKVLAENSKDVPFPGWEKLTDESLESEPRVLMLISDSDENPVRWLEANNTEGTHRLAWDLRLPAPNAIDLSTPEFTPPWAETPTGPLAAPGSYSAQLFAFANGESSVLTSARPFNVKPVRASANGTDYAEIAAFQHQVADLLRRVAHAGEELGRSKDLLRHMKAAAIAAPGAVPDLHTRLDAAVSNFGRLNMTLYGDSVRGGLNESSVPSIAGRANNAANSISTTHAPTATQRSDLALAKSGFAGFLTELNAALAELRELETELSEAGAPSWR